ncbi:hypothetical protein Vadar_028364 [Vaccinium darrowii]|nr:hypothetical protein Vadar_028364 [Vaccinium darrowii]
MSNRYAHNKHDEPKGFAKPQKKFIPKTNTTTLNSAQEQPHATHPTLSNSLRQSFSRQSDPPSSSTATASVRAGESGSGDGKFVNYLPQDEAVAAGLGADQGGLDPVESQRVVDHLNGELSRLLKLSPKDFWREVAKDSSLHGFLESFLQFRSRWYDFPYRGVKGIVAGIIVGEFELSKRVFMVLYRISSNRDPGARAADSLSPKDHAVLLQETNLLDMPKLLDICAVYGHENEDLTRSLVVNALKAQPGIHDNFTAAVSHFLKIVHTMDQRCSASLEVLFSSHGHEDHGSNRLHADYMEVMDFINDAVVSMDAFVGAHEPAAVFFSNPVEMSFGNEDLLGTLARLHDSLLPSLQKGFRIIFTKALSKMFPAKVEDPYIRADILVQTFRELSGGYSHVQEGQSRGTFLQNVEKNHKILERIEFLHSTVWISMDEEQLQYLSGIMSYPRETNTKERPPVPSALANTKLLVDEDSAIVESKISQIKDLFPDYGKGFLSACLEVYNQNPEEVIQRILEGTLHKDLQSLDTSLESAPPPKSASVSRNDKGKGKLVESMPPPSESKNVIPALRERQTKAPSVSSSSSVGRFVRKSTISSHDSETLDSSRDEMVLGKTAALISQLQLEYEDEYDDSFDDLGFSVADSGVEETETLGEKLNSSRGKSSETETGSSAHSASNSNKWGSRKTPQFYVKDGKNYSYKVAGSVAVANYNEATIVNQAQREMIHGLGRGGNLPLGAVKKLTESNEENEEEEEEGDGNEVGGRGNRGNLRGRGGGRRGGGRNNYRKDRAMKKHFSGISGF